MIDSLIRNLQQDINLLQRFIEARQKTGLHDMERMIESLTIRIFRVLTPSCNLINMNQLLSNFPAIDLADNTNRIAVQVTTNATPAKIKKTIDAFEKARPGGALKEKYDKLYILGFCKSSKYPKLPQYCHIIDMDFVVNELIDNGDEAGIQEIIDGIRRHQSYVSLHPWKDIDCLKIILNCIDRNAIKHKMSCEGNILDMSKGLKEINELISKGTIDKREKSKSIDDFQDQEIASFLSSTRNNITKILAIVNKSKSSHSDFVCINQNEMMEIDNIKDVIAEEANAIAKKKNIDISINIYN
ncbi:regulator [Chromobacterium violaceum]|nr:SMEK domain-containing protein [Chromobacterium violaceum]OQS45782.1 regulator [Chromobacterium violaceum]OQS46653.1 regulator [Chromobacterium violaceum]